MERNKKIIELFFYVFLVTLEIILLITTHAGKQTSHYYLTGGVGCAVVLDRK
ncbi:hypothetical protein CAFE_30600 [Caprobacter fermentans]|uniref:Uncharacterized protein n=1 Tax=Caproicibacter fermentans TaxID=2576756 RepID=A0A6N8I3K6_9FIRM|nr:hypothetical protein [Caproicibacter fermentans]MVB12327.1 hypothetical protein [Caproicibacter fermentans]